MNRKQIIRLIMGVTLAMSLTGIQAQEAPKATERKEIIIREKAGKEEKMTIVVDGDKVTINGKPLAEYDGDNIIIRKKNFDSYAPYAHTYPRAYAVPRTPRTPRTPISPIGPIDAWGFSFDDDAIGAVKAEPRARLGVVSEKNEKGAKITEVMPESAAAKAGLKIGDIITAVDGKKVDGPESLSEQIRSKKPEQESEITYLRDKKSKKMKVKLGTSNGSSANVFYFNSPEIELDLAPHFRALEKQYRSHDRELKEMEKEYRNHEKEFKEMERQFRAEDLENFRSKELEGFRWEMDSRASSSRPKLGVRIQDQEDGTGVKVIEVQSGSVAEKAGFKNDDILTHIDDKKVTNTDQARELLRESGNKSSYPVTVERNGKPFNMTVKNPKEMKKADL